jgi:hypothetical protein
MSTTLTLTRKRVSEKNGMASYKADGQRSTGTVYFDKKMFNGNPPESLQVIAEGIVVPVPPAPKPVAAAATEAAPAVEGDVTGDVAGEETVGAEA